MKIAHVVFSLNIGGMEEMLIDIINRQSLSENVSLIIINKNYDPFLLNKISKNIKIVFINRKPKSVSLLKILSFNLKIWKLKPNIIHAHNFEVARILIIKIKTILTIHNVNLKLRYLNKYDHLVSISKAVYTDVLKRYDLKSTIIYNGIRIEKVAMKENFKFSKFRIVQVGRLDHNQKGQHVLIEAVRLLRYEKGIKNLEVEIIGDGKSKDFLNELIQKNQLTDIIQLSGLKSRNYIFENLKNYELFIQPSLFEGFGLTIIEAMAAKVPVLCSNIDGPKEILQNGEYGFLYPNKDFVSLAEKIVTIIKIYNSGSIIPLLEKAYIYASNKFNIGTTVKEYLTFYNQVLGSKVF